MYYALLWFHLNLLMSVGEWTTHEWLLPWRSSSGFKRSWCSGHSAGAVSARWIYCFPTEATTASGTSSYFKRTIYFPRNETTTSQATLCQVQQLLATLWQNKGTLYLLELSLTMMPPLTMTALLMECLLNMVTFCMFWTEVMRSGGKLHWWGTMPMTVLKASFPAGRGENNSCTWNMLHGEMHVCSQVDCLGLTQ